MRPAHAPPHSGSSLSLLSSSPSRVLESSPPPKHFPPKVSPSRFLSSFRPRNSLDFQKLVEDWSGGAMAAAAADLTRGAVEAISEEAAGSAALRPVLQVVDLRQVSTAQTTSERYRMMLSDGTHSQQAMLATSLNCLVREGRLLRGSIVHLNEFICNTIQSRRIIIVINLQVLQTECEVVGSPKLYELKGSLPGQALGVNSAANDPHSYGGSSCGGQGMKGSPSVPPKPEACFNNPSYGGSYGPMPARNSANINVLQSKPEQSPGDFNPSYGGSSGPMPARNTTNINMLQSKPEQSPGDLNQNQRFAVPAQGGGYHPPGNTYGRPMQPSYQQPPPMYMNRGPIAKNEAPSRIVPIAALNPYQGRWTIKARVTSKRDLRRFHTKSEGKVFSFDLLDEAGGEIRATCFNEVADQFFHQIEVGKVYLISRGNLKPAQRAYNNLSSEYEVTLENSTSIQPCSDDNSIPKQQYNFRLISEVENMENNSMVDLIGVVTSISPAGTIMRKNGTETQKRTLQLKDMSGRSVEITLWGNFCNAEGQQLQSMCDSGAHPVLALKAGRVSDFSGRSVGTIGSSQLVINPDFPETEKLKEWYISEGKTAACISLSREMMSGMGKTDLRKTVAQIKDENLGRSEKPDWITVKATISFIKPENFCYTACPLMVGDRQCNKKVNNNGDGSWHCDRCDKSFPECDYRYLLQFQIQDHTGITWVTAFQEAGVEIMGHTAKELHLLKYEEQDDVRFADIMQSVLFGEYLFKLKVKEETFSDEQRVKSTIVKAEKVITSKEGQYLLGVIDKLLLEDSGSAPVVVPSNAGFGIMETKPSVQPANSNCGISIGGPRYGNSVNQLGQQGNEYGGISTPLSMSRNLQLCSICGSSGHNVQNCPSTMNRQDQSAGGGFAGRSFGASVGGNSGSNVCFKCQQPGHWARDCPGLSAAAPTYGNAGASGGYNRQSYVGGY